MSQPRDNLERALAENGSFDPERAKQLREKAVAALNARMRWVERIFWVFFLLLVWAMGWWFVEFMRSASMKNSILAAVLLLIIYESTVLMKLWYWTMNNKISVLKEIKQLRLETSLAADREAPMWGRGLEEPARALPRWERLAWLIALIAMVVVGFPLSIGPPIGPNWRFLSAHCRTLTSEGCVTLSEEGSGSVVTQMSFVCEGISPMTSFSLAAPKSAALRFTDARGRKLPFSMSPQNGQMRYDVSLIDGVMPGRRFSCTRVQESSKCATQEGGVWTYTADYSYGYDTNEFAETVVLPEGAEIVSVTPWPVATFTLSNKPTVRFETTRSRNEPFKYTIQYRLPSESPGATPQ
jgi:hypothetical protein